ncbi:MAG TPA: type II secretion system F family protein [Bacillota bacterium]|nr:type II secretion system F family protein [Bacillota bacterium]
MFFRIRFGLTLLNLTLSVGKPVLKLQLISKFKSQGKYILEIKEASSLLSGISFKGGSGKTKKLSKQDRLVFTQQLSGLLTAGIPLDRALGILSKLQFGGKLNSVIIELRRLLQEGLSFTAALEKYPDDFPGLFTNMVKAGEAGGVLPEVLKRLAQYQEEEINLQRKIVGSLSYPIIVMVAFVFAIFFFVGVLIPQFKTIFEDMGADLPLITRVVMLFGTGLLKFWWVLALIIGAAAAWFVKEKSTPEGRLRLDGAKLKLPLVGILLQKIATAKMSMALNLLCGSGVSLLTSLDITSGLVGNCVMGKGLKEAAERVQRGNTLANSMMDNPVFPVLAVEMIAIGEESGSLGQMMDQVAKTFDGEVQHALSLFLSIFEPVLIFLLIGGVGVFAVAILLPIINISSQLG